MAQPSMEFKPDSKPFTMAPTMPPPAQPAQVQEPAPKPKDPAQEKLEKMVAECEPAEQTSEKENSDKKSAEEPVKLLTETLSKIKAENKELKASEKKSTISVSLLTTFLSQMRELRLSDAQVSHCISEKVLTRGPGEDRALPETSFRKPGNPNRKGPGDMRPSGRGGRPSGPYNPRPDRPRQSNWL